MTRISPSSALFLATALLGLAAAGVVLWPVSQPAPVLPKALTTIASTPLQAAGHSNPSFAALSSHFSATASQAPAGSNQEENSGASTSVTPAAAAPPSILQEPLIPVAFAQTDATNHFTPQQLAELTTMREDFAALIETTGLHSDDPAYYERWKELQAEFDERFRSKFGDEAFNAFLNSAFHQPPR